MMTIVQCAVGGYDDNFSYCLVDGDTKKAAVIDPAGNFDVIESALSEQGATLEKILITHSHFDHVEGVDPMLRAHPDVTVFIHENAKDYSCAGAVHAISEGEAIIVGKTPVKVLHTPGHIADAVCYLIGPEYSSDGKGKLFTGDTLFVEGCGRTTSQDVETLWDSLQRLAALPEDTQVHPGHDYGSKQISTIGWEKEHNRFLLCKNFEDFRKERLG